MQKLTYQIPVTWAAAEHKVAALYAILIVFKEPGNVVI